MPGLTGIMLILLLGYILLQLSFCIHWLRIPPFRSAGQGALRQNWTLLVPMRNEALALPNLLQSFDLALAPYLWEQNPPELIFIDDHSEDETLRLAEEVARNRPWLKVLRLPESIEGKKAALEFAICQASGCWLATLDADVRISPQWLGQLDAACEDPSQPVAIAGPVMLDAAPAFWGRFQALDFCGMMLITAASLRMGFWAMGNGANLAFSRQAFEAVGAYSDASGKQSQSGDDMVLLGKLAAAFPARVFFLKSAEASVWTKAQPDWRSFVQQRWRWSAKTGLHLQWGLSLVLGWVWLFHLALLLSPLAVWAGWVSLSVALLLWLGKLLVDALLLGLASRFFGRAELLSLDYPLQSLRHMLYVAGIGTLALLPFSFDWKGRRSRY